MAKIYHDESYAIRRIYMGNACKKYSFFNFVFDCIMIGITFGLWIVWIFVREMRKR